MIVLSSSCIVMDNPSPPAGIFSMMERGRNSGATKLTAARHCWCPSAGIFSTMERGRNSGATKLTAARHCWCPSAGIFPRWSAAETPELRSQQRRGIAGVPRQVFFPRPGALAPHSSAPRILQTSAPPFQEPSPWFPSRDNWSLRSDGSQL